MSAAAAEPSAAGRLRSIVGGSAGNLVEWYDWYAYSACSLYFSRAAVPWGAGPLWHHIGIYAYRRAALDRFVQLPESLLERREGLEQLRALEAGMRVGCVQVAHGPFGVDTPADLARARALMEPA